MREFILSVWAPGSVSFFHFRFLTVAILSFSSPQDNSLGFSAQMSKKWNVSRVHCDPGASALPPPPHSCLRQGWSALLINLPLSIFSWRTVSDRLHLSPILTPARLERRSPDTEIRNPGHHCHVGEAQGSVFLKKGQITSFAVLGKKRANIMCFLNANGLDVPDKK